ncbi:hypothetical protein GH810_12630 [Acetobacterium paludosum]|uniref:HTH cro/C1-type domain-containing protein n=1 Tax=Acetobacterium paludosum TaxID=52693 RepID=A0A923KQH9_9FIRM|nr:helix-turn-helix transcriptional regulator [Acetobacterium paludosum]MBC3889159.1 hypothetical protein [Acetobacterium paludosum]
MGRELGNAVKAIIQEKKISVFQLAKEVDVDRTTLQHFFTGKRKIHLKKFQEMMTVLNLTKERKKALYTLYEKECDEKELIKNVQDVFSLYTILSEHVDLNINSVGQDEYRIKNDLFHEETQIIKGQVEIEALIRSAFIEEMDQNEKAHIIMSINFKHLFLYESIIKMANGQHKCGKIQNIIPLVNKKKLGNNLDILNRVLPLKCLENVNYEPYYFYTGTKIYDDISIIVPNYFITSKHVIIIDRDFESAIISDNPQIITYYREKAQSILNRCEQLVEKKAVENPRQSIPALEKIGADNDSTKYYTLDQIHQTMIDSFEQPIISREKQLLTFPDKNSADKSREFILRDSFISDSGALGIQYLVDDEQLVFYIFDKNNKKIIALCVSEIGIVTVFKELFDYLPYSFYVYSPDEIDEYSRKVENTAN